MFKNFFQVPRGICSQKTFVFKNHVFSGFRQKFFRIFSRTVLAIWWKLLFSCPEEHVSWKVFPLAKLGIFFQNPSWSKIFSIVMRNLFDSIVKSGIYVSTETFWRERIFFSTQISSFLIWWLWPKHFRTFGQKFCQFCRKLQSTYPEEKNDENSCFQKFEIVLPLPEFEWKIYWILAEKLLHDCRKCICVYRLHLKEKLCRSLCQFFSFVLHFDRIIFLSNFFRLRWQNRTLCASSTNWGKYCFEKVYKALTTFGHQGRSFWTLAGNFPQFRQICILFVRRLFSD